MDLEIHPDEGISERKVIDFRLSLSEDSRDGDENLSLRPFYVFDLMLLTLIRRSFNESNRLLMLFFTFAHLVFVKLKMDVGALDVGRE